MKESRKQRKLKKKERSNGNVKRMHEWETFNYYYFFLN